MDSESRSVNIHIYLLSITNLHAISFVEKCFFMAINLGPSKFCNGNNVCINAKNPVSSHKSSRLENKYVCD